MFLKGRLGLEGARVAQKDRHGMVWLGRGNLTVDAGTLRFVTAGHGGLAPGAYSLPYQMLSAVVIEPGTTISHDALRILARHGTALIAAGAGGVRMYASMPFGPDQSARARAQVRLWSDPEERITVARRMYAWRLGELFPNADITVLRGMEGSRMKETYRRLAEQYGVTWRGRRYDRSDPRKADPANQAINHASSAMQAAASIAVAATGTIPQLGFIHEDSGLSFPLDIADLFRDAILLPIAFGAVKARTKQPHRELESLVRERAAEVFRRDQVVAQMIDRIKELLDADDRRRNQRSPG